ncbi:thiamin pyrimidine pyrophosphate hydrolase [Oceanobacillus picturae]|uniref:Thiamin pyrimidine pyrophosphate hydrolase n=1 Tax=Oceanobacillus picturae TaxID=171693 RepID=A0A0U9H568_9BACI|nr:HAD-IIB family hydrolase [Oceanobacillus picturae]GAQ16449.1 thiamin pyrimidine pyrophosphate hydrolase [Oceanobacillus picturae]
MKYIFDLDGTICFKGQPVSEALLVALEKLVEQGHEVIFATARPIRDILPVLPARFHHYPMVGGNGSLVAKNGEILSAVSFSEETLAEILSIIKTNQIAYLIDGEWDYAYTGPARHPILKNLDIQNRAKNIPLDQLQSIVKILLFSSADIETMEEKLNRLDVVVNKHGDEGILDISPRGVDKWHGLQKLGIEANKYIAFGNDVNDIAMFQHALHTVMVGENKQLVPFASEYLQVSNIESLLPKKLQELSEKQRPINI